MSALEQIVQRGKQLRRFSSLIQEKLGPELESHCRVANIRNNTLVLVVASTSWATRLRYQIPGLLQRFQLDERLSSITDIQIRVSPENTPRETKQPRRATMSADAAYCIRQCADSVSDEQLSGALTRLANRQAKKN
jgi:hypothetical protein